MPDPSVTQDQNPAPAAQNSQNSADAPALLPGRDPLADIMERMEYISQRIDSLTPPPRTPEPTPAPNAPATTDTLALSEITALRERPERLEPLVAANNNPIQGVGTSATIPGDSLRGGHSGLEQVEIALEALIAGSRPQSGGSRQCRNRRL